MHPSTSRTLARLGVTVHLQIDQQRQILYSESQTQTTIATEVSGPGAMCCDMGAILFHSRAFLPPRLQQKTPSR